MEIKIDEHQVQEILDQESTNAIKRSFASYEVRGAMEKAIADSVIPAIMTEAIIGAANMIDKSSLTMAISQEISKALVRGVQAVIRDSMVEILLSLRKVPSYDKEATERARSEIVAKVFNNQE